MSAGTTRTSIPRGTRWRTDGADHKKNGHRSASVALHLSGARIVDIAAFLGHANINTTYAVYSTPSHEQLLSCLRLPWMKHPEAGSRSDALLRVLADGGREETTP